MAAHVLCVDDDRHLCQILQKALAGGGYRVSTAFDGDEALSVTAAEGVDLVLLDLMLPKRDGFEVLEAMRSAGSPCADVPVLLMSDCRPTPEYQKRARSLGAQALLTKPVPLDALLERVKRYLKSPPPRVEKKGKKKSGAKKPPLAGSLAELAFPHLLHQLHGLRATGVLLLANGKRRKAIQLRDGYPVAVKSNLIGECLGNHLVRKGRISKDLMQESLQRMQRGEGLQGQILVAMQVLDEKEVSAALRAQAEEKLFEVFAWKTGRFKLEIGGRLQRGNALALERSPANVILEGIRSRFPLERIDRHLRANAARAIARVESPFYRFQEVDLTGEEEAVLGGLDGRTKVGDFAKADERLRRTIYGLLVAELLQLRDAPARQKAAAEVGATERARAGKPAAKSARKSARKSPRKSGARAERTDARSARVATTPARPVPSATAAKPSPPVPASEPEEDRTLRTELASTAERLRGLDYFQVLGVAEDVDDERARSAYEDLAQRFHPDRYAGASDTVRQLADEVFQLISQAHEALADKKSRSDYALERQMGERRAAEREQGRRALDAETQFQKGEALLRQRDFEGALIYFGKAVERHSEEGEYHAYYGWCLHLCHPDNAVIVEEAIEHVQRGTKLARDREKPYLFLGRLYKVVGRGAAAEKMFTRAVQIRPDCVEAMRELRLINLRRQKSKGLIGRLFRR